MKTDNPFDRKLQAQQSYISDETRGAVIWTVDTLDLPWAGTQAVFGERATPEQAIELLKIIAKLP